MIALLQRVTQAEVRIGDRLLGAIGCGILALIGVRRTDDTAAAERLAARMLGYRIFPDAAGRMSLALAAAGGGLLLVPQFTLVADTARGMRPGFSTAAPAEQARLLFEHLVHSASARHAPVACGEFGAHMQVSLINDGPVTFWLET